MESANLYRANLESATLVSTNLLCANLSSTKLSYAKLCSADLSWADLNFACLTGADLSDVDLQDTHLNNAVIDDHIVCLDRIGSSKRRTTYNITKDIVWCGCFCGTFKEWVAKIRKTYPNKNDPYRREYEAAIAFFKTVAAANEEKAQNG